MPGNGFEQAIEIAQDLLVPETHYPIPLAFEVGRARLIGIYVGLLAMLAAVQFDDKPCLKTEEIGNVSTNRMLPSEFRALNLTVPQPLP
jgi:hypothetical protein